MQEFVKIPKAEYEALLKKVSELQDLVQTLTEQLAERNKSHEKLESELNQLKRKPYQRTHTKKEGGKKPRGRKKGHLGSGRKTPKRIDKTVRIEAGSQCPDCGTSFSSTNVERKRTIIDIEPIRPTINTQYVIERGWCAKCRIYHESPVTDALPRRRFGFQLMLFVVYQKVALGLSYGKIQEELERYFGLTISKGQLSNIVTDVSKLFGASYADLVRIMRMQKGLYVDETGWKVDGDNHWLWVFVNNVVTLFVLSKSRGSKVPKALLGSEFEGTVMSDFFSAYSPLEVDKAKCWAHLLRETHQFTEGRPPPDPGSEPVKFHNELHDLYWAMGLALLEIEADPDRREQVHANMRNKLSEFADKAWEDADCIRLAKRINKHLDELVVWLINPEIDSDNNIAERALRPAVVTRKTSFGSRSKAGAHAFARMLSVIMSWRQQDVDFFEQGQQVLYEAACSQN